MKVRVLGGTHAGEVRDFPVPIAQRLVAEGRAVRPDVDVTPAPVVEAVTSTWRRKKRRR